MKTATVHQAKTNLSRLLAEVEAGEEVLICRGNQPIAKLVPLGPGDRPRVPVGTVTSAPVTYSPDCFAPLGDDDVEAWGLR